MLNFQKKKYLTCPPFPTWIAEFIPVYIFNSLLYFHCLFFADFTIQIYISILTTQILNYNAGFDQDQAYVCNKKNVTFLNLDTALL